MSISLDNYGQGQKLTESVLRALVTHGTNHEQLASLARPHGYTGGPQLGVAVRVNHETGGIMGSVMKLFGEGNPVVMKVRTPARRFWLTASRQLELSLQIRVSRMVRYDPGLGRDMSFDPGISENILFSRVSSKFFQIGDVDFPNLENPGEDNKGYTAWYQLSSITGCTLHLPGDDEAIPKDEWERHGVTDGMFRLAFAPISSTEAMVYGQIVPVGPEAFRKLLEDKEIPEDYSGIIAIRLPGSARIALGPQEAKQMKAGLAILPFLVVNGPEDVEVTLPTQEGLKQELFNALRAVSIPRNVTSPKDYEDKLKCEDPPKAEIPKVMWPKYLCHQGNNASGKCIVT